MKFSQRIGLTPAKKSFQKDSIDEELRNSIWNAIHIFILNSLSTFSGNNSDPDFTLFAKRLWIHFFKRPVDSLVESGYQLDKRYCIKIIREWFFEAEWYEVYDLLDYCIHENFPISKNDFIKHLNAIFERENSAYRIIDSKLSPITNTLEIEEIEEALKQKSFTGVTEVNVHLSSALNKLSDRHNPDYRNSIKESISAVESLVNKINASDNATLGQALNKIDSTVKIHSALKDGFKKIYGYTSDSDGIRHALTELPNCDFEDAKFMIVSCSAFINYILAKADKAGIDLN